MREYKGGLMGGGAGECQGESDKRGENGQAVGGKKSRLFGWAVGGEKVKRKEEVSGKWKLFRQAAGFGR